MLSSDKRLPDFIIIGAMKCATTTLHEQLKQQPMIFMTTPKEPAFFSDDYIYERGIKWYTGLFSEAPDNYLCGESSTHYTKLPGRPNTVLRLHRLLPDVKMIYVMRHPLDRLVSHYIHEWSLKRVRGSINKVVHNDRQFVDFGRYAMQLRPYFRVFTRSQILPVFFGRLTTQPQAELERIASFIGVSGPVRWNEDLIKNKSSSRMRLSNIRDGLLRAPGIGLTLRTLVPERAKERINRLWTMQHRPGLSDDTTAYLQRVFDEDLAELGEWLGVHLSCENFRTVTSERNLSWVESSRGTLSEECDHHVS